MKRLFAVLGCLAALALTSSFLLRDFASAPAEVTNAIPVEQSTGRLQLELTQRLRNPPPMRDSAPVADNWVGRIVSAWQSFVLPFAQLDTRQSQPLIYLAVAAFIGLVLGLLGRKSAAAIPLTVETTTVSVPQKDSDLVMRLRSELDERNDAIQDLETSIGKQVSATVVAEDLATRDARIAAQSLELEEKTHRLRELESEIACLAEREQPLEHQLDVQTKEIFELQQDLSTRRSELQAIQDELATTRGRCESLETQQADQQEQIGNLTSVADTRDSELSALQKKLTGNEIDLANWKDSVDALEKEIENRAATIKTLEEHLSDTEKHANSLRVERDGLSDTLSILQDRFDHRKHEFDTAQQQLENQIAAAESELEQVSRSLALLNQKQDERDALVADLTGEVEAGQQQILGLETEIGNLQDQKEKMKAWQSTIETNKSDLRRREKIIDSLRDEIARLSDSEQQVLDQRETIAELETELDDQTVLTKTLTRDLDELRKFKDLAEQYELDIEQLKDGLLVIRTEAEDWRSRIPPLEESLNQREVEIDRLQMSVQTGTQDMEELEKELADWRVKMTAMESGIRERDAGLGDLRQELEDSRDQIATLTKLKPELERIETELTTARTQLDMEARAREKLEAELGDLKSVDEKLAAWDSTITTLRSDLRVRGQTVDALLNGLSDLAGTRVSVSGWDAAIGDVKSRLDNRERECVSLRAEIDRLEIEATEIESLQQQRQADIKQLESRSVEIEALQQLLGEQQAEIDRLELRSTEIEPLRHQLDEHQANLEAMRSEVERTHGAMLRADQAEVALEQNRQTIAELSQSLREHSQRVDDLELEATRWINKHATLNSKYESQSQILSQLREKFDAQRQIILKMRAEKLSEDGADQLPTLTKVIRPGDRRS